MNNKNNKTYEVCYDVVLLRVHSGSTLTIQLKADCAATLRAIVAEKYPGWQLQHAIAVQ